MNTTQEAQKTEESFSWMVPTSYVARYQHDKGQGLPSKVDVMLITHPRDAYDLPRIFPWAQNLTLAERQNLVKCLKPTIGEIIVAPGLTVGILFLPFFADEVTDPRSMAICRKILQEEGVKTAGEFGAQIVCLGGLSAALSQYGKRIKGHTDKYGITITTGHSLTINSVMRTYLKAIKDLEYGPEDKQLTVIGMGSIGSGFCRLLAQQKQLPKRIVLIDKPNRADHLELMAQELRAAMPSEIFTETTSLNGDLRTDSALYQSEFVVSAVSNAYVIDINKVAPGTVLVDDSQPYCWSRQEAWKRCLAKKDIAPCEAGLVDCGSIGYVSHFPFDFSDHDASGSNISWSCLAEGLLHYLDPTLPDTLGEPTLEHLIKYSASFDLFGFKTPNLQCGENELPVEDLMENFRKL